MHLPARKPEIARYQLRAKGFLNALSKRRVFEGALIRIDGGFACLHPWPELGDPSLDQCLADLQGARRWPIVKRAIRCAEFDRAAREHEDSLFEELEIPQSHATLATVDMQQVGHAVAAGFSVIKLKCGRALEAEAEFLDRAAAEHRSLQWRLDFNESVSAKQVAGFLKALSPTTLRAIDFLEDPCPYAEGPWTDLYRQFRLPLAVDRESAPRSSAAQVMVIKPAIDEPLLLAEAAMRHQQRVVLTSYMEHPVGQAFAAWEAARLGLQLPGLVVGTCGLQTHHLFEPDAFTEVLGAWSPEFHAPQGTGIGFDDLLEEQAWTRLY